MRRAITFLIVIAFAAVGSVSLVGQGKGKGSGPKATPAAQGPKGNAGQSSATRGPKTTNAGGPKTTPTAGGPQSTTPGGNKGSKGSKAATTTAANTPTSPNLPRNQQQVDRLRTLLNLPPGTDMAPYAAGFKNQGQFVAAVHVSENLGINFTELKTLMVDQNMSLGQSIHKLKPTVDADAEVRRAMNQSQQ
jgi:hypothetical protein